MTSPQCPIGGGEGAERIGRKIPATARRPVLYVSGWIALVAGVIGAFVPLWPTTCFLLLAAWCFARSSPRMYDWLHSNAFFGEYLRMYRDHRTIPRRVRGTSVVVLWASIVTSLVVVEAPPWLWALLLFVALAVTTHLYSLRVWTPRVGPATW